MEKQKNYKELKKKAELSEKLMKLINKIDMNEAPKTEKGLSTKVKEIMEKLNKKIKDEK